MIKFFRKLRQQLLTENKFSKYLLYAIGEIILVVIGILIALQFNTWQIEKKDRQIERTLLENIKRDLESDIQEYRNGIYILTDLVGQFGRDTTMVFDLSCIRRAGF